MQCRRMSYVIMLCLGMYGCADDGHTPAAASTDSTSTDNTEQIDAGAADSESLVGARSNGIPPSHPYLSDSAWPTSHGSAYAQGASANEGPGHADGTVQFVQTGLVSITLTYGPETPSGESVIWGSQPGGVFKAIRTTDTLEVVSNGTSDGEVNSLIAGAYTVLDVDGVFYRTFENRIEAWVDDPGDPRSEISKRNDWVLPDENSGAVIGLALTWDGTLVFATEAGQVGAIDRALSSYELVQLSADEVVSNSIAVDEAGGVFVVTDKALYRAQWTGTLLSLDEADGAWRATYDAGDTERVSGRLGFGSGSTPSLMGGPGDPHRFVAITDGQDVMHLALFWRDDIPDDAPEPPIGEDPRLAAMVAVDFGDSEIEESVSEQSVLVSDYRAVVVSNLYEDQSGPFAPILAGEAPKGIQQFRWDPETFTLESTWYRQDISCPNGIPAMSRATNAMYCTGKQGDTWTFESLDWDTGESRFRIPTGAGLEYNSVYSATQIGLDGELITSSSTGIVRYAPAVGEPLECRANTYGGYPSTSAYVGVHAGPLNNDLVLCNTAGTYEQAWHALASQAIAQPNTFSPSNDTTYVTTSQPTTESCTVHAIDVATGETQWCATEAGAIGSSVTVDEDGHLFLAADNGLVSWTADGVERWRQAFQGGERAVGVHFHPTGPVATVTTDGRILMVDRTSGEILAELDAYAAFGLVAPPAGGGGLSLQNALPEPVRLDFESVFGDTSSLLEVFAGASDEYTDNTLGVAPTGEMYVIGAGAVSGEGALVQIRIEGGALVPGWMAPTTRGSASSPAISPDGRYVRIADGNGTQGILAPGTAGASISIFDIIACDDNTDSNASVEVCGPAFNVPLAGPALGAAPVLNDAEHLFWNVQLAALLDQDDPDLVKMTGEKVDWESFLPDDRLWTSVLTLTDRHILGTTTRLTASDAKFLTIPLPGTAVSELAVVDRATGVLVSTTGAPADSTSTVTVDASGAVYVTVLGLVHGFATETAIEAGLVKYVRKRW